ncbi:B-cell receptor CD22-like [Garra rufa]|uniref:B-cell receptor CD22-like n=1 Tax=Garra rufa TaxID=137080 RepID=UPI003CCEDCD5
MKSHDPPESVSVSISPSGEIKEGDSVTLICNSDSNSPTEISWYKGETLLKSGDTYSITNITSEASGNYYCSAKNKHGSQASAAVTVNVMYPPKSVSVSISPSAEIVEGDSVILICSSDSNPPAEFSWFKEGKSVGSGLIYNISKISSGHSGEYKCKSINKHGEKDSDVVMLNVMYKPRNVVVNLNSSAEIVEGDLVTLICSSDSNPPALNFSWFKEGKSVGSGKIYSISNISSDHSGEYKCGSRNKHGEKESDVVMLNVMYKPRNVVVNLHSSAEIVEGDSVTLICSSDSNPPALNFSWFKEGKSVGSGKIYSISNISSDHSGEYKCKSINKHGEKDSDVVMLNVMYKPRNVVVNLTSSAEIEEGDSVTLICSSDSNPPALNFSWFKEGKSVGSGKIYSISNISSDHSGEYKCKSINKHGEKDSDVVMLNVMYKPRNVVVNLHSSAEIVEGDSVTLICSSDSNPPALNFSWFKENQTSAVGSGQSFSISSFNSSHSGLYYCEAQNEYGSEKSASVSVTVKAVERAALHTVTGLMAGCGGLIFVLIITIIIIVWKRRREGGTEDVNQKQTADSSDDTYTALDPVSRTSADIYSTIRSGDSRAPDDIYTALQLQSRSSEYETLAGASADPH